jgi:hypothetical protein
MNTIDCNYCGEKIAFLHHRGRIVPVNAETVTQGDSQFEPSSGHICHFDTCPEYYKELG